MLNVQKNRRVGIMLNHFFRNQNITVYNAQTLKVVFDFESSFDFVLVTPKEIVITPKTGGELYEAPDNVVKPTKHKVPSDFTFQRGNEIARLIIPLLKPQCYCVYIIPEFTGDRFAITHYKGLIESLGCMFVKCIPIGDGNDLLFALVFVKGDRGKYLHRKDVVKRDLDPVWKVETKNDDRIPSVVYHRLIKLYSNKDDVCYFPDCGKGQGLIEAEGLGRKAIGNESDVRLLQRFIK